VSLPPEPPPGDVDEVSVGQLMGNVTRDLSTLLRQELALAKAELRVEARKAGRATGMLAGAGVAGWMVLVFLSVALWAGLSDVIDAGLAGLVVAVVWALIAAGLYIGGRDRLREVSATPDQTVTTLRNVPEALKRGGRP
jgi:hypothetical protein